VKCIKATSFLPSQAQGNKEPDRNKKMNLITQRRSLIFALVIVFLVIFAFNLVFTHNSFTARFPGGNDSIPRYVAVRAWLFEGLNPYSEEVTARSQRMIYGRLAKPDEDRQRFAYPFYVIFFYIPFAFFTWDWAQAAGIVTLEFALVLQAILSMRLYKWSPPRLLLAFTLLWSVTWYHAARTIILFQFAGIAALLIVLGLWAVKEKHDVLGGIALTLASAKPQMLFLLLPLIGIWSLFNKRWRLALSMSITMFFLFGASFLFCPTWVSDMQTQLADYTQYTHIGSPLNIITKMAFPSFGTYMEWGLIGIFLAWLLWEWWQVRFDRESKYLDWVIALTLIITNMIVTRTATTNYIMMLPALFFIFKTGVDRFGGKANFWILTSQLILAIGVWILFALTVQGSEEQWPVYLPLPLGLLAAMLLCKPKKELFVVKTPLPWFYGSNGCKRNP
jgi:hypothetical protein